MNLWNWLWGKKDGEAGLTSPIASAPSAAVPPGMQQLQLSAPAAVPTSYGIQRAIELMRALPVDEDSALVLRVVRKTLRSTGVSLEEIVTSAKAREEAVVRGIESDRAAIEQLEIQIATRRANITRLEADLDETRNVRSRIEEALESETQIGGSLAPEEIMRIRAEAAAKAAAAAPPAPAAAAKPAPLAPPPPKKPPPIVASKPPPKLPSSHAPPAPKRPAPPAPPAPSAPSAAAAPAAPDSAAAAAAPPAPPSPTEPAIPDTSEFDDAFNEPTAKREIDVTGARGDGES